MIVKQTGVRFVMTSFVDGFITTRKFRCLLSLTFRLFETVDNQVIKPEYRKFFVVSLKTTLVLYGQASRAISIG